LGIEIIAEQKSQEQVTHEFGGLFSDEGKRPSEKELAGETPSEKKEEAKAEPAATPKPEGDKKEEPKKEAKEEKKEDEKKPVKPPEGFVPKEALAEARAQVRTFKDKVAQLEAKLSAKPIVQPEVKPAEDAKWEKFKVLSDQEYDQLVEDDPIEAQKYSHKLNQFERYQGQKEAQRREAEQSKERFQSLVNQSVSRIKEAIPGIYEEGNEVASQLAEFAAQNGFEDDSYLDAMTNPATLIVPPGNDKSFLLGPGAESLIKLIHNLKAKLTTASDPAKLKEEITKELEPKLREEITKELVTKFKDAGTGKFKSLTEVPGSGEKPDKQTPLTEEQWARLSPEDREKYLMAT
jgi:hypothetical protein